MPTTEELLHLIRPAVRNESIYRVRSYPGIEAKLNQNECPFDLPAEVKTRLLEHYRDTAWNRYPSEFGDDLRRKIAEVLGWTAEGVLLGNGSNELAQFLGTVFIATGTDVVVLDPMFSLFEKIVRLHDGSVLRVACEADFSTDPQKLIAAVTESQAPLTIIATPNNPTGKAIDVADLERVVEGSSGIVLIDEAYHEFVEGPNAASLLSGHPNVLVLRTLSKTVGLAGLRLGYLLGAPELVQEIMKARLPFMIDELTSIVAQYVLDHPDIVDERVHLLTSGRRWLLEKLSRFYGVEVIPTSTNFLLFRTGLSASELERRLAGRGVLVRNVSGYDTLERFVRVNVGTQAENKAFVSALKLVLSESAQTAS